VNLAHRASPGFPTVGSRVYPGFPAERRVFQAAVSPDSQVHPGFPAERRVFQAAGFPESRVHQGFLTEVFQATRAPLESRVTPRLHNLLRSIQTPLRRRTSFYSRLIS
jgi:hypothetical protein